MRTWEIRMSAHNPTQSSLAFYRSRLKADRKCMLSKRKSSSWIPNVSCKSWTSIDRTSPLKCYQEALHNLKDISILILNSNPASILATIAVVSYHKAIKKRCSPTLKPCQILESIWVRILISQIQYGDRLPITKDYKPHQNKTNKTSTSNC